MARARKWVKCDEKITDYIVHKDKPICLKCYESYINSKVTCTICNLSIARNKEYTSTDKKDYKKTFCSKECYDKFIENKNIMDQIDLWLKDYYKMDKLNPRIFMQLNEFQTKLNMTPQGILYTLNYIKNETNKELLDNSLTIVTWFYESAKQHYIEKQKIKDKIEEFNKLNSSMFQKSSSTVKVHRAIDNRKENILITEINFN